MSELVKMFLKYLVKEILESYLVIYVYSTLRL